MFHVKRLAALAFVALIAFACLPCAAIAQGCGNQNPNCIVPTAPAGTSNSQAASTAFVQQAVSGAGHNPGGTSGQQQYNNNGNFGGFTESGDVAVNTSTGVATIQPGAVNSGKIAPGGVANSNIAPGAANTFKGSLNGSATSDIALTACTLAYQVTQWITGTGWQCGIIPVIPSRAIAAALNLSAFTSVETQGYAQPGDGGGALFHNIGTSANFLDSFVNANPTIAGAGSGCTNASYFGVVPTGGNGTLLQGNIVVSGGVMTSFTFTGTGGNGYKVGDVLTIPTLYVTCTTQPTITVTSVSTPLGSFSDTAGDHFQITANPFNHSAQFGAVGDWTVAGGDAAATNNQAPLQALISFASRGHDFVDNGGHAGSRAYVDQGSFKVCGALMVPNAVRLDGVAQGGSVIKECTSNGATQSLILLGDPLNHLSSFYNGLDDLTLFPGGQSSSGNAAMVYSNSEQQGDALHNVTIYSGNRFCVFTETGYGGTAFFHINQMYCVPFGTIQTAVVQLGYPQAIQVIDGNTQFSAGSPPSQPYIVWTTGAIDIVRDSYCEEGAACVANEVPSANTTGTQIHLDNVAGSASMGIVFSNVTGSFATGITKVGSTSSNGASCTVFSGGSCVKTGNVVADTIY